MLIENNKHSDHIGIYFFQKFSYAIMKTYMENFIKIKSNASITVFPICTVLLILSYFTDDFKFLYFHGLPCFSQLFFFML
jgi:hypothetical protein